MNKICLIIPTDWSMIYQNKNTWKWSTHRNRGIPVMTIRITFARTTKLRTHMILKRFNSIYLPWVLGNERWLPLLSVVFEGDFIWLVTSTLAVLPDKLEVVSAGWSMVCKRSNWSFSTTQTNGIPNTWSSSEKNEVLSHLLTYHYSVVTPCFDDNVREQSIARSLLTFFNNIPYSPTLKIGYILEQWDLAYSGHAVFVIHFHIFRIGRIRIYIT